MLSERLLIIRDQQIFYLFNGKLYSWGKNDILGVGNTKNRYKPTSVCLPTTPEYFVKIHICCDHLFGITDQGSLYVWGYLVNTKPKLVIFPDGQRFVKFYNNYVLTNAGNLYVCDVRPTYEEPVFFEYIYLPDNQKFVKLFLNYYDSNAFGLTDTGNLYAWGNNEDGQLGIGTDNFVDVDQPTLVNLPNIGEKFIEIFMQYHSVFGLTNVGNLYAWGDNFGGRLGVGDDMSRFDPTLVCLPTDDKIRTVYCNGSSIYVLTHSGNLYAWGSNIRRRSELGDTTDNIYVPTLICLPDGQKFVKIYNRGGGICGLTDQRNVYSYEFPNVAPYLLVCLANKEHIIDVYFYTYDVIYLLTNVVLYPFRKLAKKDTFLTKQDEFLQKLPPIAVDNEKFVQLYFEWGREIFGLTDKNNLYQLSEYHTPQLMPLPKNEQFVDICCTDRHIFGFTNQDNLYAWGWNYEGQLGVGDTKGRNLPTLIEYDFTGKYLTEAYRLHGLWASTYARCGADSVQTKQAFKLYITTVAKCTESDQKELIQAHKELLQTLTFMNDN